MSIPRNVARTIPFGSLTTKGIANTTVTPTVTLWRDGVRCDEVSLGYPRDWRRARGVAAYLRQVLPAVAVADRRPARDPFLGVTRSTTPTAPGD